ncbi:MAG: helix-turn-helix domain-containing protein [Flavobacteriaceae bacterium]|jgi:transcriptional regulator with XRE-family HTH domain|nr:helix-turn-helix domain-containing protein [Flavobacteriaceae bacterium]
MEIAKRIIALIELLGLTPAEFADKIGVQRSGISHITSGRNKPSLDFLESTLKNFPSLNAEWLILGKGKPLKLQNEQNSSQNFGLKMGNPASEEASALLFPLEDFLETEETKKYGSTHLKTVDYIEKEKNIPAEEKKKIEKIVIFYNDGSFEKYEN